MNSKGFRFASVSGRPQNFTIVAAALLSMLLCVTGGCQGRREEQSAPARILFDSLVAANEAMYASSDPNLGYARRGCVEERAVAMLGLEPGERLSAEAAQEVRSRHSRTEWEAVNQGLMGDHPAPTPEFCARIDSLWYARTITKTPSRP